MEKSVLSFCAFSFIKETAPQSANYKEQIGRCTKVRQNP